MHVIEKVFSITISLSRQLQSPELDLLACLEMAEDILILLIDMQQNSSTDFSEIWKVVSATCVRQSVTVDLPRSVKTKLRKNAENPANKMDAETFYRSTIFEPFLESVVESITLRFREHKNILNHLQSVVPIYMTPINFGSELHEFLQDQLTDCVEVIKSEIKLWQKKWDAVEVHEKPKNALEALDKCDPNFFPNIHYFLKVLATLPVTSCPSERSFSTLRQLKNYLRNTISEERLTSLVILYIHRNYPVDVDSVIEKFISIKRRRMLS
ncbi:52 kDa repressor of the inhibitor of the protein kinase [Folsomia candida]|uniref:52 kDa repressor of the inhibitor of the protein kinase n=1 Tax=Folsomia candida TaxID=158441 RepID=A0A226DT01_FOLCA|nr:52 kDa repressor of the inhibitor of the protein kinase [Folsomia candida]